MSPQHRTPRSPGSPRPGASLSCEAPVSEQNIGAKKLHGSLPLNSGQMIQTPRGPCASSVASLGQSPMRRLAGLDGSRVTTNCIRQRNRLRVEPLTIRLNRCIGDGHRAENDTKEGSICHRARTPRPAISHRAAQHGYEGRTRRNDPIGAPFHLRTGA
jgi:hypothetical protein